MVDDIVVRLAHADDTTAAGAQAGALHVQHGAHAVVVGMRGADFGMESAAGVQVVVDPTDTRGLERARLALVHDAGRHAQLEVGEFGLDGAGSGGEAVDIGFARAPATRDHAVPFGARSTARRAPASSSGTESSR